MRDIEIEEPYPGVFVTRGGDGGSDFITPSPIKAPCPACGTQTEHLDGIISDRHCFNCVRINDLYEKLDDLQKRFNNHTRLCKCNLSQSNS